MVHIWPNVGEAKMRFFIFQLFIHKFSNILLPLKHILASPTLGQIYIAFVLQPFEIVEFQMKPPVDWMQKLFL